VQIEPSPPTQFVGRASGGRFLAAQIDNSLAMILFLFVGMTLGQIAGNVLTGIAALSAFFGYFFLPEWLLGTTIGKSLFSLRIRQLGGERCTARQIAVRTLTRVFEVNPVLLGGIPAGIAIFATERRQRLGDLWAGTVVVRG
jgi:uncharacterized RDD family membrane protein YckC